MGISNHDKQYLAKSFRALKLLRPDESDFLEELAKDALNAKTVDEMVALNSTLRMMTS